MADVSEKTNRVVDYYNNEYDFKSIRKLHNHLLEASKILENEYVYNNIKEEGRLPAWLSDIKLDMKVLIEELEEIIEMDSLEYTKRVLLENETWGNLWSGCNSDD